MIAAQEIDGALRELGVQPSDTLFVHSDLRRLVAAAGTTRRQKLDTIVSGLTASVPSGTLILPTFTYSFCRREVFDLHRSRSTVGVLSEHFRQLPGVRRTAEPIFSCAVAGQVPDAWEHDLFAVGDKDCFGERSVFAYLLEADAKLAFVGVDPAVCTFIYLIEQRERVPYRYFKPFRGVVADGEKLALATARYYVRDIDRGAENDFTALLQALREHGELGEARLRGGATVSVARASAVATAAHEGLRRDPFYLLGAGHARPTELPHG